MVKLDRYIGTQVFFSILAVLGIILGLALLFAFIGLQLGLVAGGQRALYKQIDHFQPFAGGYGQLALEHLFLL